MPYYFPAPPIPAVPIIGDPRLYAVSRIFCVGKNYAAHAREMGSDPNREPPFYFTKSASSLTASGACILYPAGTDNLHYEMELVVALSQSAFRISPSEASSCVFGYACGLDMTRRDLQTIAKNKGQPWDLGKSFEHSAVIAPLILAEQVKDINASFIRLSVNGKRKQDSRIGDMTWKIPEIISNLSQYYHLQTGDLIYTGTPEGVGAVVGGDVIEGEIEGVGTILLTLKD